MTCHAGRRIQSSFRILPFAPPVESELLEELHERRGQPVPRHPEGPGGVELAVMTGQAHRAAAPPHPAARIVDHRPARVQLAVKDLPADEVAADKAAVAWPGAREIREPARAPHRRSPGTLMPRIRNRS